MNHEETTAPDPADADPDGVRPVRPGQDAQPATLDAIGADLDGATILARGAYGEPIPITVSDDPAPGDDTSSDRAAADAIVLTDEPPFNRAYCCDDGDCPECDAHESRDRDHRPDPRDPDRPRIHVAPDPGSDTGDTD